MSYFARKSHGFTLIEVLIGSVIFLIVMLAAFNTYTTLFRLAATDHIQTLAVQLAHDQFEIVRNLPYASIGIVNGVPNGVIAGTRTVNEGGVNFIVQMTVRNISLSLGSTTASTTAPTADNKLVEVDVTCGTCQNFSPVTMTGQFAPAGLETTNPNNGALGITVFDANGQPVQGASINAMDVATTTPIIVNDVTNNSGVLEIIDIPSGVDAYSISATKAGYSSDQNYKPGAAGNPNPLDPYSTVAAGQITDVSFSIDKLSSVDITSVATSCVPVPNFHFSITGAKQIGANLPKYSQNLVTDSNGMLDLNSMEWDSYTISSADSLYDLSGLNPLNPISLAPNSSQNISLLAIPKNPESVLFTVEDGASQTALAGATVQLTGPGGYLATLTNATSTGCIPSGEIIFQGLSAGTYTAQVSAPGYTTYSGNVLVSNDWQEDLISLSRSD